MTACVSGEMIVVECEPNTGLKWVEVTRTRAYIYWTYRHACQHTQTKPRTQKQDPYRETLLLHFDRDLFGHILCASCQPSSTAAI